MIFRRCPFYIPGFDDADDDAAADDDDDDDEEEEEESSISIYANSRSTALAAGRC